MRVLASVDPKTQRTQVLALQADTFADERILSELLKGVVGGMYCHIVHDDRTAFDFKLVDSIIGDPYDSS